MLFVKPKHFEFVNPELQVEIRKQEDRFILSFRSKAYAKYMELDLREADCKFSGNYFDVSAGSAKEAEVKKDSLSGRMSLEEMKGALTVRSLFDMA